MEPTDESIHAMEKIVEALKSKSPKELLSYAILNEKEEARYYEELAKRAKMSSIKALFTRMGEECMLHHEWLYGLFKKMYPDEEPVKVEAPLVEVAPFYPYFESLDDYLSALKYCMRSELFAKKTYELLAESAQDEESRTIALTLTAMEEEHYHEIRKIYELMVSLRRRGISPLTLEPGGYLFTDDLKAKYFLRDFLGANEVLIAVVREKPEKFREMFSDEDIEVFWVTKTEAEDAVHPGSIPTLKKKLCQSLQSAAKKGKRGVVFVQNLGYIALELGFKDMMDFVAYLKDCALLHDGYVITTAVKEAFDTREWALLTSELKELS